MKVLIIGTDVTIFEKGSASRRRIEEYARLFDEYHVVIYTRRGFKKEALGPGSAAYPTNSWSVFLRPFDAVRIGSTIIRENGIDVISVQDPAESGIAGWMLKKKFGKDLHVQVHSDFLTPFFRRNSLRESVRYLLARFILPRGDFFRVVSLRIKNSLETIFGIPPQKIAVLPIFIDRMDASARPQSVNVKDKYPEFDFIVLMVSRLVREKNIFLALRSFRDFKKEFPGSGLVIAGDGPARANIKIMARHLGIDDNVRFEGWVGEPASYYRTADLYLLTSNFEGYGRSVVEAVAAGLPVVMTDVGVAGEIVVDHDTGYVVPPQNPTSLVRALGEARRNYEYTKRMAQKARERVLRILPRTWDEYLKMYKDSFEYDK